MKLEKFDIELDSIPDMPAIYFAGEILSGRVILNTSKIETIKSKWIRFFFHKWSGINPLVLKICLRDKK